MNIIELTGARATAMRELVRSAWAFTTERLDADTLNVEVPDQDLDDFTDWVETQKLTWRLI